MKLIFAKAYNELKAGRSVMLVSVAAQAGSAPRGVGAQMLISAQGRLVGSIGGGNVELLAERHAQSLLAAGASGKKAFDLKAQGGSGMVCGGDITVWFNFMDAKAPFWLEFVQAAAAMLAQNEPGWLRLSLTGANALLNAAYAPLCGRVDDNESLLLPLPIKDRAIIFGGGHCAQALVPVLNKIGFRVSVMDDRPQYANAALFPDAEKVILGDFNKISQYIDIQSGDYAIVMTNGHNHDIEVEKQLLAAPPYYIGVIGSKSKKAFSEQKLKEAGFGAELISRVHTPIGTAIKAATPEEIAISIAGEMICCRAQLREACGIERKCCPMH